MKEPIPRTTHHGRANPLGVSPTRQGTNFAIYAREQSKVTLILHPENAPSPLEYPLDPMLNRTGQVWHIEVRPTAARARYRWRVGDIDPRWGSNICLDPCALAFDTPTGPNSFNDRSLRDKIAHPWCVVLHDDDAPQAFDWQDVPKPRVAWRDLVIYEMHVRGFSRADGGGTYMDVVERIPYLKALGVTAVELLPIMEFNETEWAANSVSGSQLCNYWGYSTISFFIPMARFAASGRPGTAVRQFQYMVRELHRAGIEVILDVVYNHTAEIGLGPADRNASSFVGPLMYGMKQLAPNSYYIVESGGHFSNFSGCGNTVSCNHHATQELIVNSIKYWAHELGVDGFRFDLASAMTRGTDGQPMQNPPIIERLSKDVGLRDVKLIAEPWDCGGLYQVGHFPHYGEWGEWNGKFRDAVRRFVRGDQGASGEFATRLCGSQDLYGNGRRPFHSINFVTAHDGFTLADLVSYNEKRNHDNGEQNGDGEAHNLSWNCGAEGATSDGGINALRSRQMRNMLVALFLSAGTPMLVMGDEYGHSRGGNNNSWCQDGELNWFNWGQAGSQRDGLVRFTAGLISLRKRTAALRRENFLSDADVSWHGSRAGHPEWDSGYNLLACAFHGEGPDVYVAFNCGGDHRELELPRTHGKWARVVDTNLEPPRDIALAGNERILEGGSYKLAPFSCIVLLQNGGQNVEVGSSDLLEQAFDKMKVVDAEQIV